jgi:MFS family permease
VALAVVAGVGTALYGPAMNAALPTLTTVEQRSAANALYGSMMDFGITLGPGIAALVMLFSGPALVLGLNGATFLISAALLYGVPMGRSERGRDDASESLWRETRAGARAAAAIPGLLTLLAVSSATVLAAGGMNVAEPLLATSVLHAAASGFAILVACYGSGMVAGSLLSARAGSRVAVLRRWWLAGLALNGAAMLATSIVPSLPFAVATFALTGISNTLVVRPEIRLLQELAPDQLRGRVFGLRDVSQNAAFLVAVLGAGVLLGTLGPRVVFAIDGAIALALVPVGSLLFRPRQTLAPALSASHNA